MIDWLGDHLYAHGMKAAFQLLGRSMGPPRPPRLPLPPAKVEELRAVMDRLGLFDRALPPVARPAAGGAGRPRRGAPRGRRLSRVEPGPARPVVHRGGRVMGFAETRCRR